MFCVLALGDVHRATHELHQLPGCVQNRMGEGVNPFDSAVSQKDSEFQIVFRLFTDGSLDGLLPPGSILRMNSLQAFLPTRHALFWIEAIDPIPFLGQMQGVSSRYAPNPTRGMREPLGFGEIRLAVLQSLVERKKSPRRIVENLAKLGEFVPADHRNLVLELAPGQRLRTFHEQPEGLRNTAGDSQTKECRHQQSKDGSRRNNQKNSLL